MSKKKPLSEKLWDLFSSIKLSLYLFIILALLSVLAIYLQELFPPNYPLAYWESKLDAGTFNLFMKLGVFTPYSSFWYVTPLALLILNVTICTINRTKRIFSAAFGIKYLENAGELEKYKNKFQKPVKTGIEQPVKDAIAKLKEMGYKIGVNKKDGLISLFASKHGWARLGAYLTHSGLVLLFIGGILQIKFGFRTDQWAMPGQTFQAPQRDFSIRVDDFRIETNQRGQLKDFICEVTVLEDGKEVKKKVLEVNAPLYHDGLTFYQASYRPAVDAEAGLLIQVTGTSLDSMIATGENKLMKIDQNHTFKVVRYVPHFMMDNGRVYSASANPENPAVQIELFQADSLLARFWTFQKFPDMHRNDQLPFTFKLVNIRQTYETGLQIVYNPGATFLWIGFVFITLGIIAAFYIIHCRVWMLFRIRDDKQSEICVAGNSSKRSQNFKNEFLELKKFVKSFK